MFTSLTCQSTLTQLAADFFLPSSLLSVIHWDNSYCSCDNSIKKNRIPNFNVTIIYYVTFFHTMSININFKCIIQRYFIKLNHNNFHVVKLLFSRENSDACLTMTWSALYSKMFFLIDVGGYYSLLNQNWYWNNVQAHMYTRFLCSWSNLIFKQF